MIYRRSTRQRVALAALVAASATVITLDFRQNPGGPVRRAQEAAISIVAPLQDGIARAFRPVAEFLGGVSELPKLRSENVELRAEIRKLEAAQRRFPEVTREHERLLALLQEKDWTKGKTLGARVIGRGPSNHEWTAYIDRGKADGIAQNMAVVSTEGLVGRVVLEGGRYSKVLMVIDPQHAVGARLTGSGETGVLTGRSQQPLRFDLIDPETGVEAGETVVTSGYDRGIYPPGIPIGRVTGVSMAPDGLSKTAYVRPFVDFSRLDLVLVLLESGPLKETPDG